MSWTRARIDEELAKLIGKIFGMDVSEVRPELTFAGDLVAESLDYIDLELEMSGAFGVDFEFAEQAETRQRMGEGPLTIADLGEFFERALCNE